MTFSFLLKFLLLNPLDVLSQLLPLSNTNQPMRKASQAYVTSGENIQPFPIFLGYRRLTVLVYIEDLS